MALLSIRGQVPLNTEAKKLASKKKQNWILCALEGIITIIVYTVIWHPEIVTDTYIATVLQSPGQFWISDSCPSWVPESYTTTIVFLGQVPESQTLGSLAS